MVCDTRYMYVVGILCALGYNVTLLNGVYETDEFEMMKNQEIDYIGEVCRKSNCHMIYIPLLLMCRCGLVVMVRITSNTSHRRDPY